MKRYIKCSYELNIPTLKLHPEISPAAAYFAGVVDENNDYRNQLYDMTPHVEYVDINKLYTDQHVNRVSDIKRLLDSKFSTEDVTVIHVGRKYIVLDGNTRLIASKLLGHDHVKVTVYEY